MKDQNLLQEILYKLGKIESKIDMMNGSLKAHQNKIDKLEDDCSRLQETFKPVKKAYDKMTSFSFGLIVLIGSVIGGFIYFLYDKIK